MGPGAPFRNPIYRFTDSCQEGGRIDGKRLTDRFSLHADILNGRWEHVRDRSYAQYGRKAPYLTKIRLSGGFINRDGHEWVSDKKRYRPQEIHEIGWS